MECEFYSSLQKSLTEFYYPQQDYLVEILMFVFQILCLSERELNIL